ncbi:MAG: UDP-glucose/GDP-mannose dehydrogenase family protein [Acidobacteria bacterium]|nr:UDP-glucose/GDP-mannose dehydrogenase family protein [Acidobacteriota bacterium]
MKVAVLGLWHLGSVTAACTAAAGHDVIGFDSDAATVNGLQRARPPVNEPGLADLLTTEMTAGRLRFTIDRDAAVDGADVVWVTIDTPVDDDDHADVDAVVAEVERSFAALRDRTVVLISSQVPVGTTARLEQSFAGVAAGRTVAFACSPENLRLGKAIDVFTHPDRVVIGVREAWARERLQALFAPITDRLEWMSVESAEMTKHAINAFLATSVTFINEIAALCEQAGADAKEVERGLKTEKRIGPGAYLGPGGAFAGGTLARDVVFLRALGGQVQRETPLMDGVESSNRSHRQWPRRRLVSVLGPLAGRTVAVWGLTYKPGTDTLRRSTAVELCRWLIEQGAVVRAHDPQAMDLPAELAGVTRTATPEEAAAGADAIVVATEWPEYRRVDLDVVARGLRAPGPEGSAASPPAPQSSRPPVPQSSSPPVPQPSSPLFPVIDANGFLRATIGQDARFSLVSVGAPARVDK